jgi:hypothetical protein
MVCVTYTTNYFIWYVLLIQQIISSNTLSYFIYLSYFVFKKTEIRVKPGHLQQIKTMYGSVIFCKASFIFNWKHFNTLWVFFKVELFISHS